MSPAKQLYDLQQLEVDLFQAQQALVAVEAALKDTRAVEQAQARVQEAQGVLGPLQGEQRDLELSLGSLEARIQDVEKRLYGGKTANPKELQGFQQDAAMLRRQKGVNEDRLLELMLKVEEVQASRSRAQEQLRSVEATSEAERRRLAVEATRLSLEAARLERLRGEAEALVNARELQQYRALKAQRGTAVSKVERGICRACGLSLPSHELQRARTAQELVRCGSCGRFLYVS
jgi:hypothetical protein